MASTAAARPTTIWTRASSMSASFPVSRSAWIVRRTASEFVRISAAFGLFRGAFGLFPDVSEVFLAAITGPRLSRPNRFGSFSK